MKHHYVKKSTETHFKLFSLKIKDILPNLCEIYKLY